MLKLKDNAPNIKQFQDCAKCHEGQGSGGSNKCHDCLRHYQHEARLEEYADRFKKFRSKKSSDPYQ